MYSFHLHTSPSLSVVRKFTEGHQSTWTIFEWTPTLIGQQLFACKTQYAFVPSQGHTANSATSIFGSLQFEFGCEDCASSSPPHT